MATHLVRFLNYAGTDLLGTVTVEHGGDATSQAPSPEIIAGKRFTGWSADITNVTEDMTVRPVYADLTFTVTFKGITDSNYYNTRYQSFETISGFKPYSDRTSAYEGAPDIVWSEGTLGYVLLALLLGNETDAKAYMNECIKLQNAHNGTGGVLYVTKTYAMLPWEFHVWESVVSSAWLYLLIKNPSVLFPRTLRQVYYMAKISNIHD